MNKIKNFFADWSWKEKAWLAFVLIVQTVAWGHPEGKRIHADHDTDKQSEPGTGSER